MRLAALRAWLLRFELSVAPTESQRLFALTVAIGVVCGLAAVAFHFAIHFAESLLCNRALNAPDRQWLVWGIVTPTIGGLSAGLLLKYVVPNARGSGVPQVKVAFASKDGVIPLRDALGKLVVSSLQIGSGASLGREGPTVQICSGIASALGRLGRPLANFVRDAVVVATAFPAKGASSSAANGLATKGPHITSENFSYQDNIPGGHDYPTAEVSLYNFVRMAFAPN